MPNVKQKMVTMITASLNLELNMTCKMLDYTLDTSTTGKGRSKKFLLSNIVELSINF